MFNATQLLPRTIRQSVLFYLVAITLLSGTHWATGNILAPYTLAGQSQESSSNATDANISKMSDFYNVFVPETDDLLNGTRSGWLKLWTDETEFGRPTYHTSGYSPVWLPGLLLGLLTHDAFIYLTLLGWMNVVLLGLFVLLLGSEWGLDPFAALCAGLVAASIPYMVFWMTFAVFSAGVTWTIGILYAMTRYERRHDLVSWGVFVFVLSSLFYTAYPQTIVYIAYMFAAYGLLLLVRHFRSSYKQGMHFLMAYLSIVVCAVALVVPVYLDILLNASESARLDSGYEFFQNASTWITSFKQVLTIVARGQFVNFFGNPVSPEFPLGYSADNLPPILGMLAVIGVISQWTKSRFWVVVLCVIGVVAFVPPLHQFAVERLGFGLSRSTPLAFMKIPMLILMIYGMQTVVAPTRTHNFKIAFVVAAVYTMVMVCVTLYFGHVRKFPIDWSSVASTIAVILTVLAQYAKPRQLILLCGVLASIVVFTVPNVLGKPFAAVSSPPAIYAELAKDIPVDALTAVVPGNSPILGNNFNAYVNIRSVHTYNSLSPMRYQNFIEQLGGEVVTYGRRNGAINPDFSSLPFWMSNVGVVYSLMPQYDPPLQTIQVLRSPSRNIPIFVYAVPERMGKSIVVPFTDSSAAQVSATVPDPRNGSYRKPQELRDADDVLLYQVDAQAPELLIISQKYHPQWRAEVLVDGTWRQTLLREVNGFFQGVAIDRGTTQVRLSFLPYVRWAWLGHVFWGVFVGIVVIRRFGLRRLPFDRQEP